MAVLTAGLQFAGTGWTTGRASKMLFDLTGAALVKPTIQPYRDCWLFAVALLTGVDLPSCDLPQEIAEAAFATLGQSEASKEDYHNTECADDGTPVSVLEQDGTCTSRFGYCFLVFFFALRGDPYCFFAPAFG